MKQSRDPKKHDVFFQNRDYRVVHKKTGQAQIRESFWEGAVVCKNDAENISFTVILEAQVTQT